MRCSRYAAALLAAVVAAGSVVAAPAAAVPEEGAPAGRGDAAGRESVRPLVIGHRGASGYRPEHTLEAYRLAIEMGADYVEPDLVPTKDHVLVARHENEISQTTDVADRPEFADRRATKTIDGVEVTGWFTEDFTLAELKTLRAVERIPDLRPESALYDGRETIPTFDEVLALVAEESERTGREIGVAPETKHPTYFDGLGLSMEEPLVESLDGAGLDGRGDPVLLQSFETANLRELDRMTRVPLLQLVGATGGPYDLVAAGSATTYADLLTEAGLRRVAEYADAVGPDKGWILPRTPDGRLQEPTSVVEDAHDAGLDVVPYTFRNENAFLPTDFQVGDPAAPDFASRYGDAFAEYALVFGLGVDGLFSDQPDVAVDARDDALAATAPVELQLLAFNDVHGALEPPTGSAGTVDVDGTPVAAGGLPFFATHLQQLRAENPNTLSISDGDLVGGTPLLSALFRDEPTVEAMEQLGLGVATVGNHEFDEGVDELRRLVDGGCHPADGCSGEDEYAGSTATWLAANVVDRRTRRPVLDPVEVRQYGGVRVGVIGVVLDETPTIVSAAGIRGVEFLDEVRTIDRYVERLQDQGVETIVVSLHEGGEVAGGIQSCEEPSGPAFDITRAVDDAVDVVLHGHSHQGYVCEGAQEVDGKLVTQGLSNGRLITDIDLTLDRATGDVTAMAADNVVVTRDVAPDAAATALVERYASLAAPIANRPVGRITADITRAQEPLLDLAGESALGNLVADAQLAATDDEAGAVAAFMNPGGVRADLTYASGPAGEGDGVVTYGEAFTVQPFNNLLTTTTLTGEQLYAVLDQQLEVGRVLAPSAGVRYAVDAAARRVVPGSLTIGGEAVVAGQDYRITVNSFLAGGGDGFTTLTRGRDVVNQPGFDVDALTAFLTSAPAGVAPPATDRIEVVPG